MPIPYLKPCECPIIWIKQQISKWNQLACPIPSITTKKQKVQGVRCNARCKTNLNIIWRIILKIFNLDFSEKIHHSTCNAQEQKHFPLQHEQQSKLHQPTHSEHVVTIHCPQGLIPKQTYYLDCHHPMLTHLVSK